MLSASAQSFITSLSGTHSLAVPRDGLIAATFTPYTSVGRISLPLHRGLLKCIVGLSVLSALLLMKNVQLFRQRRIPQPVGSRLCHWLPPQSLLPPPPSQTRSQSSVNGYVAYSVNVPLDLLLQSKPWASLTCLTTCLCVSGREEDPMMKYLGAGSRSLTLNSVSHEHERLNNK